MSNPEVPPVPQAPNQPPAQPNYAPAPQYDSNAYQGHPSQQRYDQPWENDQPQPPHYQTGGYPQNQQPQFQVPNQQYGGQQPPYGQASYGYQLPPKKSKKGLWIGLIVGAVVLVIAVVATIIGLASAAEASAIPNAVKACNLSGSDGIKSGDKGKSLLIDMKGEEDDEGASIVEIACVMGKLEVPDSVISRIDSTTAMQGRQTANWEGYNASWSYHPDSGLNMVIERSSK